MIAAGEAGWNPPVWLTLGRWGPRYRPAAHARGRGRFVDIVAHYPASRPARPNATRASIDTGPSASHGLLRSDGMSAALGSSHGEPLDELATTPAVTQQFVDAGAWNRALTSAFFRPGMANRPVYLCIDRSVLAHVAADNGLPTTEPVESLTDAVCRHVHGEPPLRWWVEAGFGWRKAGHPGKPPFVAMLAITVLAATLSDEVANIRSYYRTLRSLLRLAPGVDAPKEFDSDVQQLWIWLREWLVGDHRGALGLPTAYPAAGWSNVGWAMSQTVLSPLDRAKLPVFFTAIGATAGEHVDGELLATKLTTWAGGSVHLSRRLNQALTDPARQPMLAQALAGELANWDGQVTNRDDDGVQLHLPW